VRDRTGTNVTASFEVQVEDTTTPDLSRLVDLEGETSAPIALSAALAFDNDPGFNATGNFSWSFTEGGKRVVLYGREAQYTFAQAGSYSVTLNARDAGNNTATRAVTVTVSEPQGIGGRELAIGLLVAAAALVALVTVVRARRAKDAPPPPRGTDGPRKSPPGLAPASPTKTGRDAKRRKRL
jgi:PKD repeat protein